MYSLLRPLLFRLDPERAHKIVIHALHSFPFASRFSAPKFQVSPSLTQRLWDIEFSHPVGLAAGLDKDAVALNALLAVGFSFVEVGTVTPVAQPGNPSPRLFRLVDDGALINRMGFNNHGIVELRKNLLKKRVRGVVGVNFGKNKVTPNESAADDYLKLMDATHPLADYIVLNVSSPNTPGLRDLQSEESLVPLVKAVLTKRNEQFEQSKDKVLSKKPPVLVKIAPDLADEAIVQLAESLVSAGVDGFIATNTTIRRDGLTSQHQQESGGLSGVPLKSRSTEVIRLLYSVTQSRVPIIGCGGIFTADDAYEKICAGADLLQVYTGFIYKGPKIIKEIVEGLSQRLEADGFSHVREAVGSRASF